MGHRLFSSLLLTLTLLIQGVRAQAPSQPANQQPATSVSRN